MNVMSKQHLDDEIGAIDSVDGMESIDLLQACAKYYTASFLRSLLPTY